MINSFAWSIKDNIIYRSSILLLTHKSVTNQLTVNEAIAALTWIRGVPVDVICNTIDWVPAPTLVVLIPLCTALPDDAIWLKLGYVVPVVHWKNADIIQGYPLLPLTTVIIPCVPDVNVYIVWNVVVAVIEPLDLEANCDESDVPLKVKLGVDIPHLPVLVLE